MDITIVIVNWNGGALLMRCLESVRAHARSASVIVIDNNSADGSREAAIAAFPEFRIINSGANLGFGRANNLARGLTATPLVMFLNPDTELMSDTLERAVRCIRERPEAGAVGCKMINPDGRLQELGLQWPVTVWTASLERLFVSEAASRHCGRWLPIHDPNESGYVKKLYGGCLIVRREVLDAVGWFDERYFMYAEDADLSQTILDGGWKLYYCSESAIFHVGGGVTAHAPGAFSVLTMQESICKMVAKRQGSAAACLYRAAVLSGALARLSIGLAAWCIAAALRNRDAAKFWKESSVKQRRMALWSLGLAKAAIPVSRASSETVPTHQVA